MGLPGPEPAEVGCKVALPLLLFLHSCTLCRKEMSAEENEDVEKFPRSSADYDQVLRDMLRRSPRPPLESGEVVVK
jgi:hypothetical protein